MSKCKRNLSMVRGDTKRYKFQRLDAEGNPILIEADSVWFSVKRSPQDTKVSFQKTKDDMTFDEEGYYHFTILPEDTNNLDFTKRHFYDVEVIASGVKTTIAFGEFILKPEVTWQINEGSN